MTFVGITLQEQAYKNVLKPLSKMVQLEYNLTSPPSISINDINLKRYTIVNFGICKYAVIFRKQHFHSFGVIFKHKGESGEGETVNVEDFNNTIQDCKGIVYCYQNAYSLEYRYISVEKLKELIVRGKVHRWENKADGKIEFIFSVNWLEGFVVKNE